ncbi:MAG: Ig-like domain repeat protein, partial [Chloroflexota bacterium]
MAEKLVLINGKYIAGEKSLLGGGVKLEDCTFSGQITRGNDTSLIVGVVADGTGNADNALHISELAVGTVLDSLSNSRGADISQIIESAIESANLRIFEDNETNNRIGWTSLTVGVIHNDRLYVGNVGNSRAYWVSASGQLVQLTRDHTFFNIYGGDPDSEEAGLVVNAVGKKTSVDVDLGFYPEGGNDLEEAYKMGMVGLPMEEGDSLILCTDGLVRKDINGNRFTSDDEIVEAVRMEYLSNKAATKMVSWAEGRRVNDNVSAVTIQLISPKIIANMKKSTDKTRKDMIFRRAFLGVGILGLLILIGFLGNWLSSGKKANEALENRPAAVIIQTQDQVNGTKGPTQEIKIDEALIRNVIGTGANVSIGGLILSGTSIETNDSLVQIGIGVAGGESVLYLFENSEAQIIFQPKLAPILVRGTIYINPGTTAGGEVQFDSFPDVKATVTGSKMIVDVFGNEIRIYCFEGNCSLIFGPKVINIPTNYKQVFDTTKGTYGEPEEMSYEEKWTWNKRCQDCMGDTVPSPTPTPTRSVQDQLATKTPAGAGDSTTNIISFVPRSPVVGEAVTVNIVVSGKGQFPPSGEVVITGSDKDCTVTLPKVTNGDPQGSCEVQFNSPGTKTLTATYGGDAHFRSSFNTSSVTVGKSTVTIEMGFIPDGAQPGDKVTVN